MILWYPMIQREFQLELWTRKLLKSLYNTTLCDYLLQLMMDGWMDGFTIGYWCCHRFKECSMAQALPYAGSTIAVRLVIPKNKTPPRLRLLGKHNHAIEKKM